MLRTNIQFRSEVERFIDAGIAYVALTMAILLRRKMTAWHRDIFPMFDFWPEAGWLYLLLILLWVTLFDTFNLYRYRNAKTPWRTLGAIMQVNIVGVVLAFFLFYILSIKNIPRVLILLYAGFDMLLMAVKEGAFRYMEPRWMPTKRLLLVGNPSEFVDFVERLKDARIWHTHVVGVLLPRNEAAREEVSPPTAAGDTVLSTIPVVGTADDLLEMLHKHSVDFVVLSPRQEHFEEVQRIINLCETEGVETWLLGSFFKTSIARARVDEFQDLPMVTFSTTPSVSWALVLKRVLDVMGSIILIILTAPIMLAAALAIKLTSPGPVLFKQRRCTLYGRTFWMYKFRTMVTEAEQMRAELDSRNEMKGPVFKMKNDPRITPVGRVMRRYSIDELPQLFNVLKGEMSLVGPRPPIPDEVKKYANWQRRRLSMRSGITCIWQTHGRNAVDFEDWMRLDLEYIDNWSLALDLRILLRTPFVVLKGSGL